MSKKAKPVNALASAPCVAPKMTRDQQAQERKWRAEDALRTLTRADEIKRDAGLLRDVKRYASEQVKTLQKVTGAGPKK